MMFELMYFISYTEHALINIAPNVIFQLENFCLNNFLINRLAYKVRRREGLWWGDQIAFSGLFSLFSAMSESLLTVTN